MEKIKILMIRHAPVTNQKELVYGDIAEIDLTSAAVKERLYDLSQTLPHGDQALWVHSGVERARLTGQSVMEFKNTPDFCWITHEGFREQNFGDLIGCRHEDVKDHVSFIDGKILSPSPPNGELISDFIQRVSKALSEISQKAREQQKNSVVIFCHGGTLRAANSYLNNVDFIALDTPPLSVHQFEI
jgi:broad specificity phosphatase PhoE